MQDIFYAGIGSRETPKVSLSTIEHIANYLGELGFILRSGAAAGADSAFERGSHRKEIWLPFLGFNGHSSNLIPTQYHFDIAEEYHPKWSSLGHVAKKLHARNVGQILGVDGSNPSRFVIAWTKDGCSHGSKTTKETGGTGQAMRIATGFGVPIVNLNSAFWEVELADIIKSLQP